MNMLARTRCAIIALGFPLMLGLPAFAQKAIEVTEDEISEILTDEGFKADINYDDDTGQPFVSSYSDEVKANFEARFAACDEDGFDCELLVFRAGFFFDKDKDATATADKLNEWNRDKWGKAWVEDGTMWVAVEQNVVGGLTKENLSDTIHWFEDVMADYVKHIGWEPN